jgi:hypothetical protein
MGTRSSARQKTPDSKPDLDMPPDTEENPSEIDLGDAEIVKQLEKSLPRWTGFGDKGWLEDGDMVTSSPSIDVRSNVRPSGQVF